MDRRKATSRKPPGEIHPNANRKLVRLFRKVRRETGAWNIRETARRLGVNQRYVDDNLMKGIEPTDATENGMEVRVRMFMKPNKPKPRKKRTPKPEEWHGQNFIKRSIRALVKATNDAVVRRRQ